MIDLEKERKVFQEHFNGEYEYVFGECFNQENGYFYEGRHDKSAYFAFEAWKKCAESKQAEIDLLKAQLSKLNDTVQHLKTESSGVHAALREQQRINEDLLEKLFGVDAGEYVIVPKSPTNKMIGNAQGCGENFLFHYQVREVWNSMIETAQEQDND